MYRVDTGQLPYRAVSSPVQLPGSCLGGDSPDRQARLDEGIWSNRRNLGHRRKGCGFSRKRHIRSSTICASDLSSDGSSTFHQLFGHPGLT